MTTLTLPDKKGEIIVVELPQISNDVKVSFNYIIYYETESPSSVKTIALPKCEEEYLKQNYHGECYQLLGVWDNGKVDFDCGELDFLENNLHLSKDGYGLSKNYLTGKYEFEDNEDSFLSLLQSHNIDTSKKHVIIQKKNN